MLAFLDSHWLCRFDWEYVGESTPVGKSVDGRGLPKKRVLNFQEELIKYVPNKNDVPIDHLLINAAIQKLDLAWLQQHIVEQNLHQNQHYYSRSLQMLVSSQVPISLRNAAQVQLFSCQQLIEGSKTSMPANVIQSLCKQLLVGHSSNSFFYTFYLNPYKVMDCLYFFLLQLGVVLFIEHEIKFVLVHQHLQKRLGYIDHIGFQLEKGCAKLLLYKQLKAVRSIYSHSFIKSSQIYHKQNSVAYFSKQTAQLQPLMNLQQFQVGGLGDRWVHHLVILFPISIFVNFANLDSADDGCLLKQGRQLFTLSLWSYSVNFGIIISFVCQIWVPPQSNSRDLLFLLISVDASLPDGLVKPFPILKICQFIFSRPRFSLFKKLLVLSFACFEGVDGAVIVGWNGLGSLNIEGIRCMIVQRAKQIAIILILLSIGIVYACFGLDGFEFTVLELWFFLLIIHIISYNRANIQNQIFLEVGRQNTNPWFFFPCVALFTASFSTLASATVVLLRD